MTSAYLQVKWKGKPHFLRMPKDVVECMSSDERRRHYGMREPVYEMKRAIYGHQESGKLFIEEFMEHMVKNGWIQMECDRAVLKRGDEMACTYVDDVLTSTGRSKIVEDEIRERFLIGKFEKCVSFLGMSIRRCGDYADISNEAYIDAIAEGYKEAFGYECKQAWSPLTTQPSGGEKSDPKREVMSMLGMINWVARTSRPDVMAPFSMLASCLHKWDGDCDQQLQRLIGYLVRTKGYRLRLNKVDSDKGRLVVCTDANWGAVGSRAGFIIGLAGEDGKLVSPMAWFSKKIDLTPDSTAGGEWIGLVSGAKAAYAMEEMFWNGSGPIEVFSDNMAIIRAVRKGYSKALVAYQKATGTSIQQVTQMVGKGIFRISHVRSEDNGSDVFTKVLGPLKMQHLRTLCCLVLDDAALPESTDDFNKEECSTIGYSYDMLKSILSISPTQ